MIKNLKTNLAGGLLFAFVGKMLVFTPGLADFGIIASLACVLALQFYLERNAKYTELEKRSEEKLDEMKETIGTQNEVLRKMALELDSIRNNVSGLKLHQSMKKVI